MITDYADREQVLRDRVDSQHDAEQITQRVREPLVGGTVTGGRDPRADVR